MTEEELLRAAARLGEREVSELDGERVSRAVLARLATEPPASIRPAWRVVRRVLVGLAAAAAVFLAVQGRGGTSDPAVPGSAGSASVLTELDELTTSELEVLLESLPPPAGAEAHPDGTSLDDLDSKSLERLLRSMEG